MLFTRSSCPIRRGTTLLAAASLFALSGCGSEGPSIGRVRTANERLKDFKVEGADWAKLGYRLDWTGFPAVTGSLPIQFIVPESDMVITLEEGSQLSILESTTGNRRAFVQLANPLTRFMGVVRDGDRIHAASEAEVFTVDPQTGILRDRKKTAKVVSTEPVQYGNLLIFGTPVGEVIGHMAMGSVGGVKAWGFGTGGSVTHKPVLMGSILGAVSQSGRVVFLDAATGGLIGRNVIYAGLETDPVSDGTMMYVASLDQSIYGFAPVGGSVVWRYRTASPLRTQPATYAGKLLCSVPGQGLVALDGATGAVLWQCKDFSNGVVVAVNRNQLVVFNGSEAALIDPERGDIIDRTRLPGISMLKPDAFVDGNLYAVSTSGVVAKLLRR